MSIGGYIVLSMAFIPFFLQSSLKESLNNQESWLLFCTYNKAENSYKEIKKYHKVNNISFNVSLYNNTYNPLALAVLRKDYYLLKKLIDKENANFVLEHDAHNTSYSLFHIHLSNSLYNEKPYDTNDSLIIKKLLLHNAMINKVCCCANYESKSYLATPLMFYIKEQYDLNKIDKILIHSYINQGARLFIRKNNCSYNVVTTIFQEKAEHTKTSNHLFKETVKFLINTQLQFDLERYKAQYKTLSLILNQYKIKVPRILIHYIADLITNNPMTEATNLINDSKKHAVDFEILSFIDTTQIQHNWHNFIRGSTKDLSIY